MSVNDLSKKKLTTVEKRSIVFAKLQAVDASIFNLKYQTFTPKRVVYIPRGTLSWILHILAIRDTQWPWFEEVLKFSTSEEYAMVENQMLEEVRKAKEADIFFWNRLKTQKTSLAPKNLTVSRLKSQAKIQEYPRLESIENRSKSRFIDSVGYGYYSAPYFWDSHDSNWWREQE
jgi:hypothetical protein